MTNLYEESKISIEVQETSPDEMQWLEGEVRASAEATGSTFEEGAEGNLVDPLSVAIYVVVAYASIDFVSDLVGRLQRRRQSLVVVDARGEEISITVRPEVPELRGRVLVMTREGENHELTHEDLGAPTTQLLRKVLGD